MTTPVPARRRVALALGLAAAVALGVLAARHPDLRFVDAVGFAARARRLWEGTPTDVPTLDGGDLVNGLYPVGYPALLLAGKLLVGDVLVAAKGISVVAGAFAVAVTARALGPAAGVFLLGQLGLLQWGSTEGTDLPAAALSLGAVLLAPTATDGRRAALVGVLAGAALLTRYTALAVVPVVIALAPRRLPVLAALVVATAPHWAVALATGASPFPDQSQNLAIAAGHPTTLLSMDTLRRWPGGFLHAWRFGLDLPTGIAGLALLIAATRRDRLALGLLAWATLHAALLGVAFANPRLSLPIALALSLGGAWALSPRWLAVAGLALGLSRLPPLLAPDPLADRVTRPARAAAELPGPCLATNPWFHQRHDGWLVPSIQLSGLAGPGLDPPTLRTLVDQHGAACVALDVSRTRPAFPRLDPLLGAGPVEGWTLLDRSDGWRVWIPAARSSP